MFTICLSIMLIIVLFTTDDFNVEILAASLLFIIGFSIREIIKHYGKPTKEQEEAAWKERKRLHEDKSGIDAD